MPREIFKDAVDGTDLRTISARIQFIRSEERRVKGLAEGQVISYRNKAGTRFRQLWKFGGVTRLVISPYDPNDKYSLALRESECLAKMATLRKHRKVFEGMAAGIRVTKARSDKLRASKKKKKTKKKRK
jgi:hypothetical protein